MKPATPQLLTLKEAAERLNQSVKTIRRHVLAGRIPAYRLSSRALRIEPKDLERYLETRKA